MVADSADVAKLQGSYKSPAKLAGFFIYDRFMRVGFFGGTFDPPHRGHLAVARAAADKFALDRVLFAPVSRQPLKPGHATASYVQRLDMVSLLCEGADDARLVASDADAPRADGLPNYTVDTLKRLSETDVSLSVIVGADSFLDLRRWREPEELLRLAEWIVVSRPGFSLDDLSELNLTPAELGRVHLLHGVAEPVSATAVREKLRAGDDASSLLTAGVLSYIRENGLYGVAKDA